MQFLVQRSATTQRQWIKITKTTLVLCKLKSPYSSTWCTSCHVTSRHCTVVALRQQGACRSQYCLMPCVSCVTWQTGPQQVSPCHDSVKPAYSWLTTSSASFHKPCHHTVVNVVEQSPCSVHGTNLSQLQRETTQLCCRSSVNMNVHGQCRCATANTHLQQLFAYVHCSSCFTVDFKCGQRWQWKEPVLLWLDAIKVYISIAVVSPAMTVQQEDTQRRCEWATVAKTADSLVLQLVLSLTVHMVLCLATSTIHTCMVTINTTW